MPQEKRAQTLRYSAVQALYWAAYVCISGYSSVLLLDLGFTNARIGVLLAASGAATVLIQPVLAKLIDSKPEVSTKRVCVWLVAIFIASALASVLLLRSKGALGVAPYFVSMLCLYLLNPLVNALGVEGKAAETIDFGFARGMGSVGFTVSSLIMGRVVAAFGPASALVAMAALFACLLVALVLLPAQDAQGAADAAPVQQQARPGFFRRYPLFGLTVLGLTGLLLGHAVTGNFGYQIVAERGQDAAFYGYVIALAVICELPPMFLYSRLEKRFSKSFMLAVSAVMFTVKIALSYLVPSAWGYLAVQPVQLFAWGLLSVNIVAYIKEQVADEDAVMGQSWFTNAQMIGSLVASLAGGAILDAGGAGELLIFGIVASALGTVTVLASLRRG